MSPSLEQLEGDVWPPPNYDSHLVTTCHALRKKPICDFNVEDLRIMIGQNIGLPHLVPIAIRVLNEEHLAEGDCYPSDLLENVTRASPEFFASNMAMAHQVAAVCRSALQIIAKDDELARFCKQFLESRFVT